MMSAVPNTTSGTTFQNTLKHRNMQSVDKFNAKKEKEARREARRSQGPACACRDACDGEHPEAPEPLFKAL